MFWEEGPLFRVKVSSFQLHSSTYGDDNDAHCLQYRPISRIRKVSQQPSLGGGCEVVVCDTS